MRHLAVALFCALLVAGCVRDDGLALLSQARDQAYTPGRGEVADGEADNPDDAAEGENDEDAPMRPPPVSMAESDLRARFWSEFQDMQRSLFGVRFQTRTTVPIPGAYIIDITHRVRTDAYGDRMRDFASAHKRRATVRSAEAPAMNEDEAEALGVRISDLVHAYTYAPSGLYQRVYQEGAFDDSRLPGRASFTIQDFLMEGDHLTVWNKGWDGELLEMTFRATLDGQALEGRTTFRNLPGGGAYPHRTDVTIEGSRITATVEAFGHRPEYR